MDRNPDIAELIGAEGIFLRTADRRRFDYVLRGVREESLSLSLSSDNDGLLDHYGRLLINKLRKTDGLQVEVFLPQNTEALLDRFADIKERPLGLAGFGVGFGQVEVELRSFLDAALLEEYAVGVAVFEDLGVERKGGLIQIGRAHV